MSSNLKSLLYRGLKWTKRSRFYGRLNWMLENQFLPNEILQVKGYRLLNKLLMESHDMVPAYRQRLQEAGVLKNGQLIMSNYHHIPMLTRMDLINNRDNFIHYRAEERGISFYNTGGSTGTPVSVGQDPEYRDWMQASYFFYNHWSGLKLGMPYFFLWAARQDLENQLGSWKDQFLIGCLQGRRVLNCRITSPDLLRSFIKTMNQQTDCHYMTGYAYEINELASYSKDNNLHLNRSLKGIYTTAENLTESMRKEIESVFKCKVYNRYGCRDAGDLACECMYQKGLHINPLYSFIEVVDEEGTPLPYGEEGQILVTSLHNYSMPLIRYAVGDQGILQKPQLCKCGRNWATLVRITGRTKEKLYLPNGKRFGGACLHTIFETLPLLRRYQIHQLDFNTLNIKIRSSVENYTERFKKELDEVVHQLQGWSGYTMTIGYEQTETFDRTPTGKELLIVHKFNPVPDLN